MERENDKRLQKLRDSGETIYSISRLDAINNCLYGAYRTYILGDRGADNCYSALGGVTHDTLEALMNNEATEADLLPAIEKELENLEVLGLSFPKDRNGGDSIKEGWVADMTHFAKTYKAPKGKFETETLFIYKTDKGYYLQGYIDLTKINKDGSITIYDYKTSSMYNSSNILEHSRQLQLYQMGKEQEGLEVKGVAWIMLKYCNISFMGKKTARSKEKTLITKTVERRKIAQDMSKYVEQALYEYGMDEIDAEIALDDFKKANSFDVLPEEVAKLFKVTPCVMKYDVTEDSKKEVENYINNTIEFWESLGKDVNNYPPRKFTKTQKSGKEVSDIFFCTNLCGHFKNCPYIHDYIDQQNAFNKEDEDDDLF